MPEVGRPVLSATAGASNSVELSWEPGEGIAPDGYRVKRGTKTIALALDRTSFSDRNRPAGTYSYTVTPIVGLEVVSDAVSNTSTITVGPPEVTKFAAEFQNGELVVTLAADQPVTYRLSLQDLSDPSNLPIIEINNTFVETDSVRFPAVNESNTYLISLTGVTNEVEQTADSDTLECADGTCE